MKTPHPDKRCVGLLALLGALGCEQDQNRAAPSANVSPGGRASGSMVPSASASADAPVDPDQPATCARCHGAVVAEWEESMHARAHHSRDPIYAGIRKLRGKREGEQVMKSCANCHAPRDLDNVDSAVAKMGVSCASCHAVHEVKDGASGALALVATQGDLLLGPHDVDAGKTTAHGTGDAPPHMKDPDRLCNACHGEMKGPTGIPICSTGVEHSKVGDGARSCVDCHMPEETGPSGSAVARTTHRSHRFLGPHRAWYQRDAGILKDAVEMTAKLAAGKLTVTLLNKSQHAVPTGFPGRMALISVEGSTGQLDSAVMRKIYVDDKGKPTLAPWAKELKTDSRLAVGEKREVVFDVPAELVEARVKLVFRLLPPPLASKLGLTDAVEGEPRVVLERTVRLTP